MRRAVAITRDDETIEDLRRLAKASGDAGQRCRLLAIAMVREGLSRGEVARFSGVQMQTLRDWVMTYNKQGPDGLKTGTSPGAPCRMSDDEIKTLETWLEEGPDPETYGIVRWRCLDLQRKIKAEFGHNYTVRGIGVLLKRIGYSHISARPYHPKGDPERRAAFKKIPGHRYQTDCGTGR